MPTSPFAKVLAPLLAGLSGHLYNHHADGRFALPLLPMDGPSAPTRYFRANHATSAHQALHNRILESRMHATLAQELLPVQALLGDAFGHTLVAPCVRTRNYRHSGTTRPYFEIHVQGFCLVASFREHPPSVFTDTLTAVLGRLHTTISKCGDPRAFPKNGDLPHKQWHCPQPGINEADRKRIHTSIATFITRLHQQLRDTG